MRRIARIAFVLSGMASLPVIGQSPAASTSVAPATVVKVPSASLGREQVATILLPASYAASRQRYPVVHLLHGGGQDHTAFAARGLFAGALARRKRLTARKIPYEYRELSPFGHSWDVWDGQIVSFVDVLAKRWSP